MSLLVRIIRKYTSCKRSILARLLCQDFPRVHSGLCLHVGCGDVNLLGWINIDARSLSHVHLVANDLTLAEFNDNSISAIYLCHVLEHFPFKTTKAVLDIFCRKLKSGGVLYLAVPDFCKIAEAYMSRKDIPSILPALMGGQDYEHNFHYAVFDRESLTKQLLASEFSVVGSFEPADLLGNALHDLSTHPLSLNLKAIKA